MADPQIRYARTTDGVNIAYFTMGEGVPYVSVHLPFSNVQHELATARFSPQQKTIAAQAMLVRYDHRGLGLSDKWPHEVTTQDSPARSRGGDRQAGAEALHPVRQPRDVVSDRIRLPRPRIRNACWRSRPWLVDLPRTSCPSSRTCRALTGDSSATRSRGGQSGRMIPWERRRWRKTCVRRRIRMAFGG